MSRFIRENFHDDGIDRRGFLECMAWAGTGLLVSISGGVARSQTLGHDHSQKAAGLRFVQISDSHIGFNKEANKDVIATLRETVNRINALAQAPEFLLHTGDISHLSKPEEFDAAQQILKECKTREIFYVPGEHDLLVDNGKSYLDRFAPKAKGWFSLDRKGVHFIGLNNVIDVKPGGMGSLGQEQLEWLERDLKGRSTSTPVVVFAHVPLWTVYESWGWGTEDAAQALGYLKRFGSVTVLNGHIHQTMQKIEGNVTFHTASSTAFPQPKPGAAPSPGPMTVPADQLRSLLGLTRVNFVRRGEPLAIIDETLDAKAASADEIHIDNFTFAPSKIQIAVGASVTWLNRDDIPHNIVAADRSFQSPVLDTGQTFTRRFETPGESRYYCALHPKMIGTVAVVE